MPSMSFEDLVSPHNWRSFDDHARQIDASLSQDIEIALQQNEIVRTEARALLKDQFAVNQCSESDLQEAQNKLFSGQVVAVDGTHSVFEMLAGIRCQIGVATTTYENKKTVGAVFVSEQQVTAEDTTVLGILRRRKKSQKVISRMLVQAVMFYMERAKALERGEEWLMFNGELVPQPLRTGVGSFRALQPCLEMCQRVLERKKVIGVLGKSTDDELLSLGLALNAGEYISIRSYREDLDEYVEASGLRGNDRRDMERFNCEWADQFKVGVYRAGGKAYVFQAHREHFDEAAQLVVRDSMFQPLRAYPLLIDYADALCSHMLSSSDFRRMVEFKLAKAGMLDSEQDEHALRRR